MKRKDLSFDLLDIADGTKLPDPRELLLRKYRAIHVTAPYKRKYLSLADVLIPDSSINSINLLYLNKGQLVGANTDYFAAKLLIPMMITKNDNVAILGDGAMSNLFSFFLDQFNINYQIYSRKKKNLLFANIKADVVINCCLRDFTFEQLQSLEAKLLWDLNYNNQVSHQFCLDHKISYVDGREFLFLQARVAIELWSGVTP